MGRRNKHSSKTLSPIQLAKESFYQSGAKAAFANYNRIKSELAEGDWREPKIEHSDFNGYRVIDPQPRNSN